MKNSICIDRFAQSKFRHKNHYTKRMVQILMGSTTLVATGSFAQSGTTTNITWNSTFNVPAQIVESGLTTDLSYDGNGRLIQLKQTDTTSQSIPYATSGRTRVWTYSYFNGDLLTSVDGPMSGTGDTINYTYNANGYLKTIVNELGQTSTVTAWNSLGQPTSVTGIDGVNTLYDYDEMGRLIAIKVNPGSTQTAWSITYTAAGDVATISEPAGAVYTLTWDDARRLTQIKNNVGETIKYTRDAMGNETARTITAADGTTAMFNQSSSFDELGRRLKEVGGENRTWSFAYDKTGNTVSITDPRSKTIGFGFDSVNRLISETERDGGVVKHNYNNKNEETTYTDPRNLATNYVRNGFGEVIQETSPDRGTTVYDYDARGLMISKKDARGITATFTYDSASRLISRNYPTTSLRETFSYDDTSASASGKGRLTQMTDASGTSKYKYDSAGRLIVETRQISTKTFAVSYNYDSSGSGKLLSISYPSGRDVSYNYDSMGRISYIGLKNPGVAEQAIVTFVGYYPFSGFRGASFANGLNTWSNRDREYKPSNMQLVPASGGASLIDRSYSFQDGINITKLNNDNIDASQTQSLTYDAASRLSTASGPYGSRSYSYNLNGNRISEVKTVSGSTATQNYTYPSTSNRLSSITQNGSSIRSFTYDASGSQTGDTRSGTTYSYTMSDTGRVAKISVGGTVKANYSYDGRNRLSIRQTLNMTPSGTTYMIHDSSDHIIAEIDSSGQTVREYIWLGDVPVAVLDGSSSSSSPTLLWVHVDHLGRPEMLTDVNKTIKWKAVYEPFGSVSSISGAAALQMRFPGQWFQLEAGLSYNWYRHYDGTLGSYTQPDPLGLALGPAAEFPFVIADQDSKYSIINSYHFSALLSVLGVDQNTNLMLSGVKAVYSAKKSDAKSYLYSSSASLLLKQDYSYNSRIVPRDGSNLYGYVRQSPLMAIDPTGLAGDGTPGNNRAQNKQFRSVCVKLKLNKDQARALHDEITGQNCDYQEILKIAKEMFCND